MFYKKKYLEAQHKLDQANTEILELKTHCEAYWSDTLKLSSLLCNSFIKEFDDDIEP